MIYSISLISNIDRVLLRSFRIIPGQDVNAIPPYLFPLNSQTIVVPITSSGVYVAEGRTLYKFVLPVSQVPQDAYPYLYFKYDGIGRLLAYVCGVLVEDSEISLLSDFDRIDIGIEVTVYWVAKQESSAYFNTIIQQLADSVNAKFKEIDSTLELVQNRLKIKEFLNKE